MVDRPKLWEVKGGELEAYPHPGQYDILQSPARYLAAIAGTGGGKTSFGALWMLKRVQEVPEGRHMAVAPNFNMLNRALLRELKALFIDGLRIAEHHKLDRVFALETGGEILLASADRPDSLEGAHVDSVLLDEAGQMDGLVWDVAMRRVGYTQGKILITTTPYAWNWLKYEVQDRFTAKDPDYFVVNFDSTMNPAYTKEEFEKQKARYERSGQGWKFDMMYRGKWARPEGLVWAVPEDSVVEPFDVPLTWPVRVGLDWGINHPTAALWLAEDPGDGRLYAVKEWRQGGLYPQESAVLVLGMTGSMRVVSWSGDGNGIAAPVWIKAFREAGMQVFGSKASRLAGISAVADKFGDGTLRIFKTCRMLLGELQAYSWKTRKVAGGDRQKVDEPMDTDDDLCSALRYGVLGGYMLAEAPYRAAELAGASRWGDVGGGSRWRGRAR